MSTKILDGMKVDYEDVLIVPKRSRTASRAEVKVVRDFHFYHSPQIWDGTPIVIANMATTGTIAMAKMLAPNNISVALHKFYKAEEIWGLYHGLPTNQHKYVWPSIGIETDGRLKELDEVFKRVENLCLVIDVANGYTDTFVSYCAKIRERWPAAVICAGNICTPEMVQEYILHGGVDIVKVGIGPGAACLTRRKTGVGYPQLSAVMECSSAAHGLSNGPKKLGLICADGGIKEEGDICKAFGGNGDFVMIGSMAAGTEQCEGEWEYEKGLFEDGRGMFGVYEPYSTAPKKNLLFYGMSSDYAQKKHCGGQRDYRASEGTVIRVPYKGCISNVIAEILGGIRSCCAYIGTDDIKYMGRCTTFVLVRRVQ